MCDFVWSFLGVVCSYLSLCKPCMTICTSGLPELVCSWRKMTQLTVFMHVVVPLEPRAHLGEVECLQVECVNNVQPMSTNSLV